MKYILAIIFFLFFSHSETKAQPKWYLVAQVGGKVSFSETGRSSYSYKPDISAFSFDENYDTNAKSLAAQIGVRIGKSFGKKVGIETGLLLSGNVHNFKKSFGDKELLGGKLDHRLTYYILQVPLSFEYQLPFGFEKIVFKGFIGGQINFGGFRPYWGESAPWGKTDVNAPSIQTAYFLPNSSGQTRRYISANIGHKPFRAEAGSFFGGISMYRHWRGNKGIRLSISYHSKALNGHGDQELIDVQTMHYDEFGVLVLSNSLTTYSSVSATENIAFDIAFVYFLPVKK